MATAAALLLFSFTLYFLVIRQSHCQEIQWRYHGDKGPDHWCDMFKSCCGKAQSPIDFNIRTRHLGLNADSKFVFNGYDDQPAKMSMMNAGHTLKLTIVDPNVKPSISGGMMDHVYNFDSLHFHWGATKDSGSEHTFAGRKFSLELHLVHYSTEYANLTEAIASKKADALAVLGVVFNLEWFNNSALLPIEETLPSIRFKGEESTLVHPFKLSSLLPPETNQFFRYSGSLTTPTCDQVVVWTVFGVPSFVSEKELQVFRTLMATERGSEPPVELTDNVRPLQPVFNRKIQSFSSRN